MLIVNIFDNWLLYWGIENEKINFQNLKLHYPEDLKLDKILFDSTA